MPEFKYYSYWLEYVMENFGLECCSICGGPLSNDDLQNDLRIHGNKFLCVDYLQKKVIELVNKAEHIREDTYYNSRAMEE